MRVQFRLWTFSIPVLLVAAWILYPQPQTSPAAISTGKGGLVFRILLGVGDRSPTNWSGRIRVTPGSITNIEVWRFGQGDSAGNGSWRVSTRPSLGRQGKAGPILENGVIVSASTVDLKARFDVETAQGNFSFRAEQVPYGEQVPFLEGRVVVDRVPEVIRLTDSAEEQDFPSVAQSGDSVYVSYVEFTHADRELEARRTFTEEPKNFDFLARPAGGDQVMLLRYSKLSRTWSAPMAVSRPKQDVMRTAVAVDGTGRVWVIWSANQKGNFDLYAKSLSNGRWSAEQRLTSDPGTDINPVAATDSQGRVWIAWQAFRNGNLEILAAAQQGDAFSRERTVSTSRAGDWDPAIAAGAGGEVAVSWDTYDKGDYDVYFRRLRWQDGIRMEAPVAVAASPNFEARSSIAYDGQNRIWVAYEASGIKWGKDFGAYGTSGIALYQGHDLQVKCFQGDKGFLTEASLLQSLPGAVLAQGARRRRAQAAAASITWPDPDLYKKRPASLTPQPPPMPLNAFPRLAADSTGAVYLSYRTPDPGRSPVGTVWHQLVSYLDGDAWKGPVVVPQTDGLLDARAALIASAPGTLLLVSTSDHRQSAGRIRRRAASQDPTSAVQTDLYAAILDIGPNRRTAGLKAARQEVAPEDPETAAERKQIEMMRNYRVRLQNATWQLMRGEFHRHTEMSGDGGRDGPLIDAYRYMLDAADMDWVGCCDHDNGGGREYYWWIQQKLTDAYHLGTRFVPMFSYERSVRYPEGHRNVVMATRGVRPLPRLPKVPDEAPPAPAPDTQMLYRYLKRFGGIVAMHTSGTNMGTDWRDNDPVVEPVVEIYQGDRQNYEMPSAPRSNSEQDSIGGWRPLGFVSLALEKGYRLGFQASSDHISTHMSYCNLWVAEPTREGIMEAFRKRRIYGATDNILADVRCGNHFMGEEFTVNEPPTLSVKLWGTDKFAKVHIVRNGQYVYTIEPNARTVDFSWRDANALKGKTSYYYVRGEQADGELVWVSPMWITYQ